MYEEQEAIININSTTTTTARIQKGVRRGCLILPALFDLFIEKANKCYEILASSKRNWCQNRKNIYNN